MLLGRLFKSFTVAAPACCVCKLWREIALPIVRCLSPLAAGLRRFTVDRWEIATTLVLDKEEVIQIIRPARPLCWRFNELESTRLILAETDGLFGLAKRLVKNNEGVELSVQARWYRGLAALGIPWNFNRRRHRVSVQTDMRRALVKIAREYWRCEYTDYFDAIDAAMETRSAKMDLEYMQEYG
eukprot:273502-Prymnesium_polylepis.1